MQAGNGAELNGTCGRHIVSLRSHQQPRIRCGLLKHRQQSRGHLQADPAPAELDGVRDVAACLHFKGKAFPNNEVSALALLKKLLPVE